MGNASRAWRVVNSGDNSFNELTRQPFLCVSSGISSTKCLTNSSAQRTFVERLADLGPPKVDALEVGPRCAPSLDKESSGRGASSSRRNGDGPTRLRIHNPLPTGLVSKGPRFKAPRKRPAVHGHPFSKPRSTSGWPPRSSCEDPDPVARAGNRLGVFGQP